MIRVGVIGAGVMGNNHARIYSHLKGVEFVGITDSRRKSADDVGNKYNINVFSDHRDFFGKVDAVSIAVPTNFHHQLAKEFLEHDIDVLVEKPITETVEEADELIALASSRNRILQVGHVERFNPAILELKKIVTAPIHIEARRLSPFDKRVNIGVVLDLMIHDLDIVLSLVASEVKAINSCCLKIKPGSKNEDLAQVSLLFENDVVASLIASRVHQNKVRNLNVAEEDTYLTIDCIKQELVINRYVSSDMGGDGAVKYRQSVITEIPYLSTRGEPLWLELEHFIGCVRNRTKPFVSGEDGRNVLDLAHKIISAGMKNEMTLNV